MTTLLLIRHAAHDWLGRGIPGRLPGVGLNAEGHAQARGWAERMDAAVDAIYSSPQQRAQESIAPFAAKQGLPVMVASEFDEIDFGDWTGRTMEQLKADSVRWRQWVERRSLAAPPGGEPFHQVAKRAMAGIDRLARSHPGQVVLVVSHGDVIKAIVASCLGLSLDCLERFDIAPMSLSVLAAEQNWRQVKRVNQTLTGPLLPP